MVIRVRVDEAGDVPFLCRKVAERPWLTTERHMATVTNISVRNITPEMITAAKEMREKREASIAAVASRDSARLQGTKTVLIRDGVAIIPVMGTIVQFADFYTEWSGGVTIETLQRDFQVALESEEVKSIMFWIDSGGGEANGISEFADFIFASRGIKPIFAYIDGICASGAYWIAAACERIYGDKLAMAGSIGAVAIFIDDKEAMAMEGLREIKIKSSVSPKKQPDPSTTEGEAQIQVWVNDIGNVFVSSVARFRDTSKQDVIEKYGAGDIMVGQRAVRAGLIDGISSFEATLKAAASGRIRTRSNVAANVEGLDPHVFALDSNESDVTDNERENSLMENEEGTLSAEEQTTFQKLLAKLGLGGGTSDVSAGARDGKLSATAKASIMAAQKVAAKAYVDGLRSKGVIKTYQVKGYESTYLTLAEDDIDNPREVTFVVGEEKVVGTRVDMFQSLMAQAPKGGSVTHEYIDPDAKVRVLYDKEGDDPADDPLGDPVKAAEDYAKNSSAGGTKSQPQDAGW